MVAVQPCQDTSDVVDFCKDLKLFLKPVARLHISVQLPQLKTAGQMISNWEVMEKLRAIIAPEEFTILKVAQSTLNFIRFEAELKNRSSVAFIAKRLDQTSMKLSGFPEVLRIRACESRPSGPSRQDWDSFFRDAKNMNEMKPGERPDTVHIANLPCRWFWNREEGGSSDKPSEIMVKKAFEQYGPIRLIDIPVLDPYRLRMDSDISGIRTVNFGQDSLFEVYIQYQEYIGFVKAMTALRGMKIVKTADDKSWIAAIKVDFDKQKHMADSTIKKRNQARQRLQEEDNERELQSKRKKDLAHLKAREEKRMLAQKELEAKELKLAERERKRRLEKQFEKEEYDAEVKIAVEERKLLLAQRKLEALRLMDVLLNRVKEKMEKEEAKKKEMELLKALENLEKKKAKETKRKAEKAVRKQLKLQKLEQEMRMKLMQKYKSLEEQRFEQQKDRLRRAVEGSATKLKSVRTYSSGAESSEEEGKKKKSQKRKKKSKLRSPSPEISHSKSKSYEYEGEGDIPLRRYLEKIEKGEGVSSRIREDRNGRWLRGLESRPYRGGPFPPWKRGKPDWPGKHPYGFHHRYVPSHSASRRRSRSRSYSRRRSSSRSKSRRHSYSRSRSRDRYRRSYTRSRTHSRSRSRKREHTKQKHVDPATQEMIDQQLKRAKAVQQTLVESAEIAKEIEKIENAELNGQTKTSEQEIKNTAETVVSEVEQNGESTAKDESVDTVNVEIHEKLDSDRINSSDKEEGIREDRSSKNQESRTISAEIINGESEKHKDGKERKRNRWQSGEEEERIKTDRRQDAKEEISSLSVSKGAENGRKKYKERTPSLSPDDRHLGFSDDDDDEKSSHPSYKDKKTSGYYHSRGSYYRGNEFYRPARSRGRYRGRGRGRGDYHNANPGPKSYYDLDEDSYQKYFRKRRKSGSD